jgi:hypothetical protein
LLGLGWWKGLDELMREGLRGLRMRLLKGSLADVRSCIVGMVEDRPGYGIYGDGDGLELGGIVERLWLRLWYVALWEC